jgi:PAS domain S-box-containing protein
MPTPLMRRAGIRKNQTIIYGFGLMNPEVFPAYIGQIGRNFVKRLSRGHSIRHATPADGGAPANVPRSRRQTKSRHSLARKKTSRQKARASQKDFAAVKQELRRCDQLLKDIQRITRLGNWEWIMPSNKLQWSDELYRIFGLHRETFEPSYEAFLQRVHPEDREHTRRAIETALQTKGPFASEHRIVRPDGSVRFLETEGEVITGANNEVVRMLGCCLDITERKQTEQRLENSVSLLNATLESTADGILVVDLAGKLVRCNSKFIEMWRLPPGLITCYDDQRAQETVLQQLKNPELFLGRVRFLYDHPELDSFDVLEFKDGRVFERYSCPQRLGKKVIGRVWSFRDVREQSLAMDTLRQSEERYRSLVIATSQVVWRTDADGLMLDEASSCSRFTGLKFHDSSRREWLNTVHPDDRKHAAAVWSDALKRRSIYEAEY